MRFLRIISSGVMIRFGSRVLGGSLERSYHQFLNSLNKSTEYISKMKVNNLNQIVAVGGVRFKTRKTKPRLEKLQLSEANYMFISQNDYCGIMVSKNCK